ncbi:high mobility group box domain-containing protein, partial [Mycotypha africana]|uniref:high mobility group box domain-containing protein n=1 Tax=Mycotypha africana TaxID=64632 RepID=UPI0023003C42
MFSISASSFTLKHRDQKKEHRIPRPPNSFLVFRQKMQKQIQEKYQGANQRDMSKIISQWWHALKPKDKQVYADEAKKLTLEHKQRYPNYKFRPK